MTIPLTFYGFRILIPPNVSHRYLKKLVSLNAFLDHPYQIAVLDPFCSNEREQCEEDEEIQRNRVIVVFGFDPPDDLTHTMILLHGVTDLLDSPILLGLTFSDKPTFCTGHLLFDPEDTDSDSRSSFSIASEERDAFSFAPDESFVPDESSEQKEE